MKADIFRVCAVFWILVLVVFKSFFIFLSLILNKWKIFLKNKTLILKFRVPYIHPTKSAFNSPHFCEHASAIAFLKIALSPMAEFFKVYCNNLVNIKEFLQSHIMYRNFTRIRRTSSRFPPRIYLYKRWFLLALYLFDSFFRIKFPVWNRLNWDQYARNYGNSRIEWYA